ncbi:hypothetical protein EG328_004412 [Venturia inaequalis]|uniref:Uncharacterized protein n=1 Tax=Venturia inaequalis TaxID=5025 RepID=A0A8H3YU00_VENIN|nr:hypothetical protein EG328_004412 [Venturia inaequalis]
MTSTNAQSQQQAPKAQSQQQAPKAQSQQQAPKAQSQQQAPNNLDRQEVVDTAENTDGKKKAGKSSATDSNGIKARKELRQEEMAAATSVAASLSPSTRPRQPLRAPALYWKK